MNGKQAKALRAAARMMAASGDPAFWRPLYKRLKRNYTRLSSGDARALEAVRKIRRRHERD